MSEQQPYFDAAGARELDRRAIAAGIPGFDLMQRAAAAAFALLRASWPQARHCIVCCGGGNNGGDGLVLAVLAQQAGMQTLIVMAGEPAALRDEAAEAWALVQQAAVPVVAAAQFDGFSRWSRREAVIVDALLGIGLTGPVRPGCASLIRRINASGLPVLALDLPSGLCSDTGRVMGVAVQADCTCTFIARKLGLLLEQGPVLAGHVHFAGLGLPAALYREVAAVGWH